MSHSRLQHSSLACLIRTKLSKINVQTYALPPIFDKTGQIEYIEMSFKESGLAPLASATEKDVLAMSVLYIFYYSGEIILVSFQTVIIMYLRRSRIVLGTHF